MSDGRGRRSGSAGVGRRPLSDLAEALLDNPLFSQALTTAVGAGERAAQAQRSAMGALNIPSASDVERLEQRLRSLSNRLESLEDRLDDALDEVGGASSAPCRAAARRRARRSHGSPCPDRYGGVAASGSGTSPDRGVARGPAQGDRAHAFGRGKAGARGIGRAPHRARHPAARRGRAPGHAGARAAGQARAGRGSRAHPAPAGRPGGAREPARGAGAAARGPRGRAPG